MAKKKKSGKSNINRLLIPGLVILVVLLGIGLVVKIILAPNDTVKREKIQSITLIKPPPEQPKEKLPEPEAPKEVPKETIAEPEQIDQPQDSQDTPAGADLGVEGEGGSGSDGFGLKGGIKGGKGITVGGGNGTGRFSILIKYAGYNRKMQDEIKTAMKKKMEKEGGVPKGKYEFTVKFLLDQQGVIQKYRIVNPSGNDKVDAALKASLPKLRISQPPPEDMPKLVTLKIVSQG